MDLSPLPADRQPNLDWALNDLRVRHSGSKRPPLSRFAANHIDPHSLAAAAATFACEWFPRVALEYHAHWHETGEKYSPSDWVPAIKAMVIDATRCLFMDPDRFDSECVREVAAALDRCSNWFLKRARYLEQQRIDAAEQRRLAKERAERAARAKPASVEIEALAKMAGVSVESAPANAPAQLRATLRNEAQKKRRGNVDGEELKKLRGSTSQEGLAAACGVSLITIRRGEAGRRWLNNTFTDVAKGLSTILGRKITPEELKTKPHPPQ